MIVFMIVLLYDTILSLMAIFKGEGVPRRFHPTGSPTDGIREWLCWGKIN